MPTKIPRLRHNELITSRIQIIRGQRVMLDADLAALYAVPTKALNQAVKRNMARFPDDFMFQLTQAEKQEVVTNCDHLKTLKFSKSLPYAFTEHGAIQAANVLNSLQAIQAGVYVVRAFVRLRELIVSNKQLSLRLDDLESRIAHKMTAHDEAIMEMINTLRQLMTAEAAPKRPIGFVHLEK